MGCGPYVPTLPVFNLVANYWDPGRSPRYYPADRTTPAQLYALGSAVETGGIISTVGFVITSIIRTPVGFRTVPTDLFVAGTFGVTDGLGTQWYYTILGWEYSHLGFPNAYISFVTMQCTIDTVPPDTGR